MVSNYKWWQKAVFYQIYPRSFADGNGDGIGDFKGMIEKLDYLQELGVDAVWLSPHFPSPYVDCGYDISDYENVAPEYGNLDDFKTFLDGLHARGMRLILDLVLNHTSDMHAWFMESRSSKNNPKRDWYIWKPGKGGNPPTNWYSTFGGSAWEYDPTTDEYYYHFFFKEQPDLNWNNPHVKEAMFNAARFWLDMGVDGFRLDAVGTIFEDERYLDHQAKFSQNELLQKEHTAKTDEERKLVMEQWEETFRYQHDLPGVHQIMRELRQVMDEYEDRVLVGETEEISFYGNGSDEIHLNFNFPMMRVDRLSADHVKANQQYRLSHLPGGAWPCNTLGNHDCARMLNQFGDGIHNDAIARQNLVLLLTLKGTPFLYYGEEIGMSDHYLNDVSLFRDTLALPRYAIARDLMHLSEQEAVAVAAQQGRDKCRTPMQWAGDANGGFTPVGVTPWLPVAPNAGQGINVADEQQDDESMLAFYKRLIAFRKAHMVLQTGEFVLDENTPSSLVKYERSSGAEKITVVLNMSAESAQIQNEGYKEILFSANTELKQLNPQTIQLDPFAALLLK
ncbi:MAG: alpha-glucosidase [Anaerolineaceae bacterium]|nr:alpha-glucosidase [Anaerolineaceae bacterium]